MRNGRENTESEHPYEGSEIHPIIFQKYYEQISMLTLAEAMIIAKEYLRNLKTTPPIEIALLETSTKEFEFGWVFFYQSKEFIETGDILSSLVGNGPIIVNKYDGSIHPTGSAHPVEYYIKEYLEKIKKS